MSLSTADLAKLLAANPDIELVTDPTGYTTAAPKATGKPTCITLDYPPSSNRYWRMGRARNGNARIYRSESASDYIQHVAEICTTAGIKPLDDDVSLTLRVYRPQRSGDLDNRVKICLDALQGYAYHNDAQIVAIHATRHEDKDCPRVEIEVTEAS